jgi:hypothetical protein
MALIADNATVNAYFSKLQRSVDINIEVTRINSGRRVMI